MHELAGLFNVVLLHPRHGPGAWTGELAGRAASESAVGWRPVRRDAALLVWGGLGGAHLPVHPID